MRNSSRGSWRVHVPAGRDRHLGDGLGGRRLQARAHRVVGARAPASAATASSRAGSSRRAIAASPSPAAQRSGTTFDGAGSAARRAGLGVATAAPTRRSRGRSPGRLTSRSGLLVSQRILRTPMSRRICAPMPKSRKMLARGDAKPVLGACRAAALGHVEHVEPAARAAQVEDDAAALGGDALHRAMQQRARVARRVAEDVAGQVLEVRAHEHRLGAADVALHEHEVLVVVDVGGVDEGAELAAVAGRRAAPRRRSGRACRARCDRRSGRRWWRS